MNLSQFTTDKKFLMLALDHRDSLKKILNPQNPNLVTHQEIVEFKSQIINPLQDQFSGLLIDPQFGLEAYKDRNKPYLLSVEKSGYIEDGGGRITELEYQVSELKELGASGIKILLYFNPEDLSSIKQLETAKKISEDCQVNNLPLFLEIVTYPEDGVKGEVIVKSVKKLLDQGVRPDVFKLEYPGSEEYCQRVSLACEGIPWILLTRGGDFEAFKDNLKIAVANGASGFLAGRSVWQEAGVMRGEEREEFLNNVVKKRFKDICNVVIV